MDCPRIQTYESTNARWRAVVQRDPAAHCRFLYGVKTTKIYCRPTCTGRIARRANVVYFDSRERAEQEGFRPCVKCKPDDVAFIGQREEVVLKTLDLIWINKNDSAMKSCLKELAKHVGVTPSYLARLFKKTMGCTVGEYCRQFEASSDGNRPADTDQSSGRPVQPGAPDAVLDEHLIPQLPCVLGEQPSTGLEDAYDSYFDIDEWLWMADSDLDSCMMPSPENSTSNHAELESMHNNA